MTERVQIIKAAGVVGFGTLLSRILGFVRDVVIAAIFGAGLSADAFFVAFRIPNLFRRLLGEGSLTVAFIPVFTEYMAKNPREAVRRLIGSALVFFSSILCLITLMGILFAPLLVAIISPGFIETEGKLDLTIRLTRLMFPYLFFIGLVALFMGVLNSVRHFAAPAISPVWLNCSIILFAILLTPYLEEPVYALSIGVLFGGLAQFVFQFPFLSRNGLMPVFSSSFLPEPIKRVSLLMLPSIIGVSVHQLNILVTTRFASTLPSGSVSYLYYADRLVEFPLGIFGIAISTAILPTMSYQSIKEDWRGFKDSISYALRLTTFISIPSMVGLMALSVPLVAILFERGEFTHQDTLNTASALFYYSIGLLAYAGVRILACAFYALKDTVTPVKVAFVSVIANIVFSLILMGPLKHGGLALATSLASIINLLILFLILKVRIGGLGIEGIITSVLKTLMASLVMGITVYSLSLRIDWAKGTSLSDAVALLSFILIGMVIFLFFANILRCREVFALKRFFKRKSA